MNCKLFLLVISCFLLSCHSNEKKSNSNNKNSDSINTEVDSSTDRYSLEKIYALCENRNGDLTDELINKVCNMPTAHEPKIKVDRIYSNVKDFSNEFSFEKLFFRKYKEWGGIQAGFLYGDAGIDYYYEIEWFYLSGTKEVVSVFRYNGDPDMWKGNMLVIISKNEEGNYFTDIFEESCGNISCGISFPYQEDSTYVKAFSNVKCYGDFIKNYKEIKKWIRK
jgi:hypothetical protein